MAAAGGKLTLFATPWTPPAFMKTNDDLLHGGSLKPEYYHSRAMYYTKFIKAYEQEGIPIWVSLSKMNLWQNKSGNLAIIRPTRKEIF